MPFVVYCNWMLFERCHKKISVTSQLERVYSQPVVINPVNIVNLY